MRDLKDIEESAFQKQSMLSVDHYVDVKKICPRGDFKITKILKENNSPTKKDDRPFLKKILIDYNGLLLADEYVTMMYFTNYLYMFSNNKLFGKEPNDFFDYKSKTEGNKTISYLVCKFDSARIIYKVEAMTMFQRLNKALDHLSTKHFETGSNSIEALSYAESVMRNRLINSNFSHIDVVQNSTQANCLNEAMQPE